MIPTIVWELRRRRAAVFWWTAVSLTLTVVIMLLYPSIRDKANQLNSVLNQLPAGLRELKTGGSGVVDVADPVGFLNSQLFYATLPILWIILAVTRGSSVLGRDEQDHTLELLLARPISRGRLLAAKGLSLLIEFIVVSGVTLVAIVALAPLFGLHVPTDKLALVTAYTAMFSLSFGFVAFALQSASSLTRRAASAIAVMLGFGGYLLASLSSLTDWLKTPAKLAPYHYFAPDAIMHGHRPTGLLVYLAGVLLLVVASAYLGFRRRDIQ